MKNRFKMLTMLAIGVIELSSMSMAMTGGASRVGLSALKAAGTVSPSVASAYQGLMGQGVLNSAGINPSQSYIGSEDAPVYQPNDSIKNQEAMRTNIFQDSASRFNKFVGDSANYAAVKEASPFSVQRRYFMTAASGRTENEPITFDTLKLSFPILPKKIFEAGPVARVQKIEKDDIDVTDGELFSGPNKERIVAFNNGIILESKDYKDFGFIIKTFDAQGKLLHVQQNPKVSNIDSVSYNPVDGSITSISRTSPDLTQRKVYYSSGGLVKTYEKASRSDNSLNRFVDGSSDYTGWEE